MSKHKRRWLAAGVGILLALAYSFFTIHWSDGFFVFLLPLLLAWYGTAAVAFCIGVEELIYGTPKAKKIAVAVLIILVLLTVRIYITNGTPTYFCNGARVSQDVSLRCG